MIALDEALARILDDLAPLDAETVALADARGRTLAAPLVAGRTQPPTPTSAMDGYAVRAADLGAAPARLKVIGESAAGHPFASAVGAGEAAQVSTGAAMPEDADQVVVREESLRDGDVVTLDARPAPGAHIRPAGVDFSQGDRLLAEGRTLDALACALAAAAGETALTVRRRPRVAIVSTGDELVEPGEAAGTDRIVNSNAVGVAGLVADAGGAPENLGIARDTPDAVRAKFAAAQDGDRGADLLVTIGGASVGDHDHVRDVFAQEGGQLAFEKIAVKPGKPTWYGRLPLDSEIGTPVLGLPGNPVSALVMARLLLIPAVRRLAGDAAAGAVDWRRAALDAPLPETGPRETLLRAEIFVEDGALKARPLANQDSAALSALAAADALIRRPAGAPAAQVGATVDVLPLR